MNYMDVCADLETECTDPKSVARSLFDRDEMDSTRTAPGIQWRLRKVDEATLRSYYRYLCERLSFPFVAWYPEPATSHSEQEYRCTVIELIDPASGVGDAFDGIFCKVRKGTHEVILPLIELDLPSHSPNHELVENYWNWFWHWR
jgi:hypothetical protein